MKYWSGMRLYENVLCKSADDMFLLILEALRLGRGALVRVFSQAETSMYIHLLVDEEKVLLAEAVFPRTGGKVRGANAIRLLMEMVQRPVVVDVYSLGDEEVKTTVLNNVDLYQETPHVLLFELFTPKLWSSSFALSLESATQLRSLE